MLGRDLERRVDQIGVDRDQVPSAPLRDQPSIGRAPLVAGPSCGAHDVGHLVESQIERRERSLDIEDTIECAQWRGICRPDRRSQPRLPRRADVPQCDSRSSRISLGRVPAHTSTHGGLVQEILDLLAPAEPGRLPTLARPDAAGNRCGSRDWRGPERRGARAGCREWRSSPLPRGEYIRYCRGLLSS